MLDISLGTKSLLVDTGSAANLLKFESVGTKVQIENETCMIRGVTGTTCHTVGTWWANIVFKDRQITHKFHILPSNLPLVEDGILGNDFLSQGTALVDYKNKLIKLNNDIKQPFRENRKAVELNIPARTEMNVNVACHKYKAV